MTGAGRPLGVWKQLRHDGQVRAVRSSGPCDPSAAKRCSEWKTDLELELGLELASGMEKGLRLASELGFTRGATDRRGPDY